MSWRARLDRAYADREAKWPQEGGVRDIRHSPEPVSILAVSSSADDRRALSEIFRDSHVRVHAAQSIPEALAALSSVEIGVVLMECAPGGRPWKEAWDQMAAGREVRPRLILFCRAGNDRSWAEAVEAGAWDLLASPFDADEVAWAVTDAWCDWHHEAETGPIPAPSG